MSNDEASQLWRLIDEDRLNKKYMKMFPDERSLYSAMYGVYNDLVGLVYLTSEKDITDYFQIYEPKSSGQGVVMLSDGPVFAELTGRIVDVTTYNKMIICKCLH